MTSFLQDWSVDLLGDTPPPAPAEPTLGDRRLDLYLRTINSWMFVDLLTPQQIKLDKLLNEMSHNPEPEIMQVAIDNTIRCIDEALKEPT